MYIRHCAARHQWSVSDALPCWQSWDCSIRGRGGGCPHDLFSSCVTFLQVCFSMLFSLQLFAILTPKSLPKLSPNPTQINETIM